MIQHEHERNQIIKLLDRIQIGYTERKIEKAQSFVQELFAIDEELLVIGTSAITNQSSEWCEGSEEIIKIIEDDWKYWGDLQLDMDKALISFHGDVAFVALTGVVYEKIQANNYHNHQLDEIEKILNEDKHSNIKLLEIIKESSNTVLETSLGEEYYWPLRLTLQAVLINGDWKIKQMHFSYPITSYPPVRL